MNQRGAFFFFLLAVITFSQDVKPILDRHCVECHSAGADLNLAHFPFTSTELTDQPSIVDRILGRVEADPPQMPPGNRPKLTESQVGVIRRWLEEGLEH